MCDGEDNYFWWGEVNPYTREVFWDDDDLAEIQHMIDRASFLVFHNAQFDVRALESIGVSVTKYWKKVEDTLLMSHILCSGDTHGLKDLAIKYLHYWDDDEKELEQAVKDTRRSAASQGYAIAKYGHPHFPGMAKNNAWWKQDFWLCPELCLRYALCDVERTFLLYEAFRIALVRDAFWGVYKLRKEALEICYDITSAGLRMDREATVEAITVRTRKIKKIQKYLTNALGMKVTFNWNKREHLLFLLYRHLKYPVIETTDSGAPATNKNVIADYYKTYSSKYLKAILVGRKMETERRYIQSYANWLDDESLLHSNLNITGTRETRQSSSGPNQQNISNTLLHLFVPPQGTVWWAADFANIEMRIWAYSIGNQQLIDIFESGASVHMAIMDLLYKTEAEAYRKNPKSLPLKNRYRKIKEGNFALIYGATEKTADTAYGYQGATRLIYKYFPGIEEFTQSLARQVFANQHELQRPFIYTIGGYPLDVPTDEPFKSCNYFTQGSAGIFMTKGMIAIHNNRLYRSSGSKMVQQVHDMVKVQIPISPIMHDVIPSLRQALTTCSTDIFRETPIDDEILYNPKDKSLLQDLGLIQAT